MSRRIFCYISRNFYLVKTEFFLLKIYSLSLTKSQIEIQRHTIDTVVGYMVVDCGTRAGKILEFFLQKYINQGAIHYKKIFFER